MSVMPVLNVSKLRKMPYPLGGVAEPYLTRVRFKRRRKRGEYMNKQRGNSWYDRNIEKKEERIKEKYEETYTMAM